jgi:hypothetical protein
MPHGAVALHRTAAQETAPELAVRCRLAAANLQSIGSAYSAGPPGGWYRRSVMCLAAWLITNAGAGLCIRMRRDKSLISATWPRFATPVRGSPQDLCRRAHTWGMRSVLGSRTQACEPKHGPDMLGLAGLVGGFLESPVLLRASAVRRPGRVVAPTSGLFRSAKRCRKDARSGSRQVPSPSRARDSGSLSVFGCRAQHPDRGSMPTPDARPE